MFIKIHKSHRTLVAVCDSNLIGKKFEEEFEKGVKQLDITENFYKGEEKSYSEVLEIMKTQSVEDSTFNIVGPESIKAAEEAGIIPKNSYLTIQEIPYALVLL
jgi:hypothetical protein|tara:strand:+ start:369 stop:677 length:309 start_codon:yes stop_codon:yes gene_type:complete